MAAATVTAGAGFQIFGGGQPAEFKGFGNLRLNRFLKLMQRLLRIEKSAGDGIIQHRFTLALEFPDLFAT